MIHHFVKTHIGQREINEDNSLVDSELGLYVVADGVGGLDKGEVASDLTCQLIHKSIKQGLSLVAAIEATHQMILAQIQTNDEKKGMASTVIAALFRGNVYEIAWVGDSRAYLWDGELKLISRDHSYLELLLVNGHLTSDEFKDHPNKNIISQALGINRKDLSISTNKGTLEKGQILLLATDGLYDVVNENIIIAELNQFDDLANLSNTLVKCAVDSDGKDNITLISICSDEDSMRPEDVIKAKIVRIFDKITGKPTDFPDNISEQSTHMAEALPEVDVKVAQPKVLNFADSDDAEVTDDQTTGNKILETLILTVVVIIILVIITLNM